MSIWHLLNLPLWHLYWANCQLLKSIWGYAGKLESMEAEVYNYLNFDQMGEYTGSADRIDVAQLN